MLETVKIKLEHETKRKLTKILFRFPDILLKISKGLLLHLSCEYCYEICATCSEFYDNCYCIEKDKYVCCQSNLPDLSGQPRVCTYATANLGNCTLSPAKSENCWTLRSPRIGDNVLQIFTRHNNIISEAIRAKSKYSLVL
uniref:DALR anticodon binding domain-containing protein n=1 Tax=Glossina pallidipes TaxID=7398 RepID=A0A1A9Z1Y7_GLOPL